MKKNPQTLLFLTFLLLFLSCNSSNEKKNKELYKNHNGYIIEGTLSKGNATTVYLLNKENTKVDSTNIEDFGFTLVGTVKKPDAYYIRFKNDSVKHAIVLENNHYKMLLNGRKSMIIGGKLNAKLSDYQNEKQEFTFKKSEVLERFSTMDISLRDYLSEVDSIRKIEKKLFRNFIIDNNQNVLSKLILNKAELSSKQAISLKEEIMKTKNAELIYQLDDIISKAKVVEAEEKIIRRKPVPLFSGVNLAGRQTHLEHIIKGKKAFLIDFWASWCPPCRAASPRLKELYHQYHKKGFDILTVSEDRSVADWKNGVFIDGIEEWHHIYDDYNRISSMFGATSLPHMVLIDENGKIIKNKISLVQLEKQLEKIFIPNK